MSGNAQCGYLGSLELQRAFGYLKVIITVVASAIAFASNAASVEVEIVTRILDFDPLSGMKSTQVVSIDFERKQITQSFSTGVTKLGPVELSSVRDKFVIENIDFSAPKRAGFTARGQTASGVLFMPNINYKFYFSISPEGKGAVSGCHDGYPAYQVNVNSKKVYAYKHPSISLVKLFGECDVKLNDVIDF